MTDQPHKPTEIGLVLQGGGALGAYGVGSRNGLLELMDKAEAHGRQITLKVVAGVSIGAINGACIVGPHTRADARRRLTDLWEDLRLDTPSFLPRQVRRGPRYLGLPGFGTSGPCLDVSHLDLRL